MAKLTGMNIDRDVKENQGKFVVLPAGTYEAVILSDELKDNKSNTGKLLEVKLQIVSGEFKRHELIDRINLIHTSEKTQAIGQGTLKRICNIFKVPFPPEDSKVLWGRPLMITVDIQEFKSNTTDNILQSNSVTKYDAIDTKQKTIDTTGNW